MEILAVGETKPETTTQTVSGPAAKKRSLKPAKRIIFASCILVVCAAIVVVLTIFDIISNGKLAYDYTICMRFSLIRADHEEEQLWIGSYMEGKNQILNFYNQVIFSLAQKILQKT